MNPFQHYMQLRLEEGRTGAVESGDDYLAVDTWLAMTISPTATLQAWAAAGTVMAMAGTAMQGIIRGPRRPAQILPTLIPSGSRNDPAQIRGKTPARHFTNDLTNDPARMYDMAVRLYLELNNDPMGRQGIAEAMFNRNAARTKDPSGEPIDPLTASYFPKDTEYI